MKKFAVFITKIVFSVIFRVEIINREKVPQKGPALLCSNHNNMLDMFLIGYKIKRWIYWMAKEELFRNPFSGYLFKKLGAFPIKRGTGDVGSIKTALKLLNEGEVVGIFPHGHRASKRKTMRSKPGAAMLAINAGVQVVPVMVTGNYRLFGKIRVIFGDPFHIEAEKDKKYTSEELSGISSDIMEKVYSLSGGNK